MGDKRWNDRWDDVTLEALERRQKHREAVLAEVEAYPRASLSPDDQINYDVFLHQYRMTVEGFKYRYHLIRTDTYGGVQNSEQLVDVLTFTSVKDYDDWLARLAAFPAYVDQNIARPYCVKRVAKAAAYHAVILKVGAGTLGGTAIDEKGAVIDMFSKDVP